MRSRSAARPRFFDVWSRVYDEPFVQWATYRPVQDAVMRALRRGPSERILDLGCGTGQLAARVREDLAPTLVVGCDFSRGMLRRASRRRRDLSWVRGDAQRLPFASGHFDTVVSTEAFHWFPDQDAVLEECHRVLAPRGRLLLALMSPRTEGVARAVQRGARWLGEPARWPTRVRLRRRAEAAGFRVDAQRVVFRLTTPLLLPCVLTVATRRD